ncbi:MAG: ABC transporter permease, partial [Thermoanaerobaculia bacterium]
AELGRIAWAPGIDSGRPLAPGGALPVLAGAELVRRLGAAPDTPLRLMVLGFDDAVPRFTYRAARLVGTFTTGFSEFDESWALIDRDTLDELMGSAGTSGILEVAVADAGRAPRIAERVRGALGDDFLVTDWRQLNRELFTALELQQLALFCVLGLIVLVSTFNVASTLVVLVRERMRELGVLSALGLPPGGHQAVFLAYGLLLGALGAAAGVALGAGVAWVFTEFELIRFDPEMAAIYFVSSVPFRVRAPDVAAVVGFTLLVTLVACWLPARRAGQVQPAAALRYE